MQFRLRTLLIVLAVGPMMLALPLAWHRLTTSNCGGNNAALVDVEMYLEFVQYEASQSTTGEFSVATATSEQRKYLAHLGSDMWLGDAQFLVSTVPYRLKSPTRRVIVVCDRPFTNVPRYAFGSAPPMHAAGLSDGSTTLLTANEFIALDRSQFVLLGDILGMGEN